MGVKLQPNIHLWLRLYKTQCDQPHTLNKQEIAWKLMPSNSTKYACQEWTGICLVNILKLVFIKEPKDRSACGSLRSELRTFVGLQFVQGIYGLQQLAKQIGQST